MARILVVDDEIHMRQILAMILAQERHEVTEAEGVAQALQIVGSAAFDIVLTDYKLPDGDGLAVLDACHDADPALPVVVLTAFATVDLAVEAMRRGAFDFITKPFMPEVVKAVVHRAAERAHLVRENDRLHLEVRRLGSAGEILGTSAAIGAVRERIARVAPTGATVLITGETGTGKELVARAIHDGSARRAGPFVAINCAAFPESLLESELFGHEKGAFTGADRSRQGLFEAAHSGTLFLDEAGEMPLALQAKLLRVLTDGQVLRLGARKPVKVDVRILSATHRDLAARIAAGAFREDLYYRLAVVPLPVPPLREHIEDLPELIEHFIRQFSHAMSAAPRRVAPAALHALSGYAFPGNIRELRNIVERALILATGEEIGLEDIGPVAVRGTATAVPGAGPASVDWDAAFPAPIDIRATLESIEKQLVGRALRVAGGVQAEAARQLGLSRSDIAYKIKRLGLEVGGRP